MRKCTWLLGVIWGHTPWEIFEFRSSQIASDAIWDKLFKQHILATIITILNFKISGRGGGFQGPHPSVWNPEPGCEFWHGSMVTVTWSITVTKVTYDNYWKITKLQITLLNYRLKYFWIGKYADPACLASFPGSHAWAQEPGNEAKLALATCLEPHIVNGVCWVCQYCNWTL